MTQESDGNLLVLRQRLREDHRSDRHGAVDLRVEPDRSCRRSTPARAPSSTTRPRPPRDPTATIYTADPLDTIEATSPQGYLEGTTTLGQDSDGGDNLAMGGYNFYLVGSTFFYQGGPPFNNGADNISTISLSTLTAYLGAAHAPADSLGWGAGLSSSAAAQLLRPGDHPGGRRPRSTRGGCPKASHLELSYSVENTTSLDAETVPTPTTIPLPTTAGGLADIPLTIPAADRQPGPYLVQASLFDTNTSPPTLLGTTCMPYTVGAAGDRLDLATPPERHRRRRTRPIPRGVALNAQLGLDGLRGATINWSTFLPNCSASTPTAATCGPFGHDLRQRRHRLLRGRLPGPAGPCDLLAPGQWRIVGLRPHRAGGQRVVGGPTSPLWSATTPRCPPDAASAPR